MSDDLPLDRLLDRLHSAPDETDLAWASSFANRFANLAATVGQSPKLDALLSPPFPDDPEHEAVDRRSGTHVRDMQTARGSNKPHAAGSRVERHFSDHVASAADHDATEALASWEGTMTDDASSGSASSSRGLEGLARLSRSGPASLPPPPPSQPGQAQGEDSGLINLKAMTEPEAPPAAKAVEAKPAAPVEAESGKISLVPPVAKVADPPKIAAIAANAAPVTSQAPIAVVGTAPAAKESEKKGGGVWILLGGLAVAAGIAYLVISMQKPDATTASKEAAPSAVVAVAPPAPSASATASSEKLSATAPPASAAPSASASVEPSAETKLAVAPKPAGPMPGGPVPTTTAATPAAKPEPKASASAEPAAKPAGTGGLDDALGIKKGEDKTPKVAAGADVPNKPEGVEVSSSVNGKRGAAAACVKGLDGDTKVSVRFGPSGAVDSVTVTAGPAKGTGAEACIQAAFKGAKVSASKLGATGFATLTP